MAGSGNYTHYVDLTTEGSTKAQRLAKLFPGSPFVKTDGEPMDQTEALADANGRGQTYLRAEVVKATQKSVFNTKDVNLRYAGNNEIAPPDDNYAVDITKPGAPMTRYVPNVKSPGAGADGATPDQLGQVNLNPSVPDEESATMVPANSNEAGSDNTKNPGSRKELYPDLGTSTVLASQPSTQSGTFDPLA